MYGAYAPFGQPQAQYGAPSMYSAPPPAAAPANIQPGAVIYAQILTPDQRTAYQLFRLTPASYHGPQGLISGLQWMAAEVVMTPPSGSKPAEADFIDSWQKGAIAQAPGVPTGYPGVPMAPSSSKSSNKDEKRGNRHSRHASDYSDTLQTARDKDSQRRSSFNASTAPPMVPFPGGTGYPAGYPQQAAPQAPPAGYSPFPGYAQIDPAAAAMQQYGGAPGPYGLPTSGYADQLARQMAELDVNRSRGDKESERDKKASRSRRQSTHDPSRPATENSNPYGYPAFNPAAGIYGQPGAGYPPGMYGAPPPGMAGSNHSRSGSSNGPSPNMKPGEVSFGPPVIGQPAQPSMGNMEYRMNATSNKRNSGEVYGPGHIMEGYPKPQGVNNGPPPKSRATTPNPPNAPLGNYLQANRPSSRMSSRHSSASHGSPNPPISTQLAAPEAFSRAINAKLPYHKFGRTLVHRMDDFFSHMPKMPQNLESHDVRNEDWFRFMEDLTLAWTGRLPVPAGSSSRDPKPPKPAVIAAELIHTWNTAFFEPRGVEMILYRGGQRRSGRGFGKIDFNPSEGSDWSSSSTSEESSSDGSDDPYPPHASNAYSREDKNDLSSARKRYYDDKRRRKDERRDRRRRKRERRRNKEYSVMAVCTRDGAPLKGHSPMQATNNSHLPQNQNQGGVPLASAYPGMLAMPNPPTATTKKSKRQSVGQYFGF
ncbi:hypothetical protein DFP72DRAFT_876213 [Ephemerocybe angulata]|uniref:Uncharacterized protein n=1 Tax=Ephemerocybe angulata TaxID=980116 RepID=A0A8H6IBR2_9AGAR|nr:hypothetical protein DFP72DRAFT_876213 [Tulosesus angulatus]